MQCQSCHIKNTSDHSIQLHQVRGKILCSRCLHLESICISTASDVLGTPPELYMAPFFKDSIFSIPSHGVLALSSYLDGVKQQLLLSAKTQAMKEKGNAIVGSTFTVTRLEGQHFLVSFNGTIVWSRKWAEQYHQEQQQMAQPQYQASTPTPTTPVNTPISQEQPSITEPMNSTYTIPFNHLEDYEQIERTETKEKGDSYESVVGKYPDVGGSTQMNRFRKLAKERD